MEWNVAISERWIPDIAFVEVRTGRALESLAEQAAERGVDVLAFVGEEAPASTVSALQAIYPTLSVTWLRGTARSVSGAAAQATAELVRLRACRQLLSYWLAELRTYEAALASLDPTFRVARPPRPAMAPMSVIEGAHVSGLLGLWFDPPRKVSADLGIGHATLRAAEVRWREHVARVLEKIRAPTEARALIVGHDIERAKRTRRALELQGLAGGPAFDIVVVHDAREAQAHIDRAGPPDLVWLDSGLPGDLGGLALAAWMRGQGFSSALVGQTDDPTPDVVRRLNQLGAVGVWTGGDLLSTGRPTIASASLGLLGDETAVAERRLDGLLARVVAIAGGVADVRRVSELVSWAESELAPMPVETGDPGASLDRVREVAATTALTLAGGVREGAARLLGVSGRTLQGLLRAG